MSQLPIQWILPLLALTSPLAALAGDESAILPMNFGQEYTGSLIPSPTNPQGEVCYGLAVKPNTRITLNVKTSGVGIVKFAVYDKARTLQFFHNHVNNQPQSAGDNADSSFSFPAISDASQLCLTTSNSNHAQHYDLIVTGNPSRKSKSRLTLRPVASIPVKDSTTNLPADIPTFTLPIPPVPPVPPIPLVSPVPPISPISAIPPIPPIPSIPPIVATVVSVPTVSSEPYCYVGTWQITDLSAYWLPSIQNFTQADISDRQMLGYARVTITKDGHAQFEAIDLEQQYTLKSKETGSKIDKIGVNLAGNLRSRFQANPDSTLTFSSQIDRRLTTNLNLGANLKLTGDKLFTFFGDRDLPPAKLPYKCLDRDNMMLKVPLPNGQKLIPISFKRVS
jgi:hypothetical protein